MFFLIKSAFCVSIVFLMLPDDDARRVANEVSRTVAQDKFVRAAVERTNLATQQVANEAHKLCLKNHQECLETAKQIVKGTANRW